MAHFAKLTQAERLVATVMDESFVREVRECPTDGFSSYPDRYSEAIDRLAEAAKLDRNLLDQFKAVDFSGRDDPRIKELLGIAIRFAQPNSILEMAKFSMPSFGVSNLLSFLESAAASIRSDRVVIPNGLKHGLKRQQNPAKAAIVIEDDGDDSRVYFLMNAENQEYGGTVRGDVLLFDGAHHMVLMLRGTRMINTLLAWVDSTAPRSVPAVVRSVAVFDEFFAQNEERERFTDDRNCVYLALFKFGGSHPPHFDDFQLD